MGAIFGKKRKPEPVDRFTLKQELAAPSRYYGDGGTIHGDGTIDIQVIDGRVTEVWYRCQILPFRVFENENYSTSYGSPGTGLPFITGVEVLDRKY